MVDARFSCCWSDDERVIEDPIQVAVDKGAYLWGLKSNFSVFEGNVFETEQLLSTFLTFFGAKFRQFLSTACTFLKK